MGGLFGGSSKTKVESRDLTREERQLIALQVDLAEQQLKAVKSSLSPFFGKDGIVDEVQPIQLLLDNIKVFKSALNAPEAASGGRSGVPGAEVVQQRLGGEFSDLFDQLNRLQSDVTRGPTASPEDAKLIEEAANRAIEAGLVDIERFQTEGLEQLRNVLAPARGLRPEDSPIIDRGGRIVREATRQAGQLISGVRSRQAEQMLQFPLARRASDLSAIGLQTEAFAGMQEFQRMLRDNAFANRLRLGAALGDIGLQTSNLSIGLASGIPANVGGTLASIAASQGSTTKTSGGSLATGLQNIGTIAGGVGALLNGIGLISSRALKEPIDPVDIEALRAKVKLLTLDRWRWRDSPDRMVHIGPYAEELHELFGVGDGRSFPIYDALGVLFALIKALDAKVGS